MYVSVTQRLLLAGAASALLWLAVWWAMGSTTT
jgi:hypothetical protein